MLCPTEQQSGVTLFAAVLLEDFILADFTVDEPIKKHLDVDKQHPLVIVEQFDRQDEEEAF